MLTDVKDSGTSTQLGAFCKKDSVRFAVWAPHAEAVSVIGDFNQWNPETHPCTADGKGNWAIDIAEARVGEGYKFSIQYDGRRFDRIDPRARQVTNSVGHGIITSPEFDWQGDQFSAPSFNELIIYELHVGTFNAPPNSVGTLLSACEKLPYLRELGINAIELMPLAEFAGDYSWGYNPAHPFAIETAYGGQKELKHFIRQAHQYGIAVLIDVVYNHFGPSDLDLWQFDGWSENGKGGIYFYNDWRSATPWGDSRPDYGRGEVRQYIYDNAMMWLEEYHADGLRYDMTLYMRSVDGNENNAIAEGYSLVQWINRDVAQLFPGKILIAEDLRNNRMLTESESLGGANFSAQWDAGFVHPIREQLILAEDSHRSMARVRDAINHKYNLDVFQRVIYTESHDEVANGKQRLVSEIDPSDQPNRYAIKRSTLGACLVLTAPGIPMLLQGQEFLRDKWFDDGRPIDWSRSQKYASVLQLYRDLIRLRRNQDGLTAGLTGQHVNVFHVDEDAKLIAMHRWKEGGPKDDVVVVFKFSDSQLREYRIGLPRGGHWRLRLNGDADVYGEHFDGIQSDHIDAQSIPVDSLDFSTTISIGAYSCLVFSQD